MRARSADGGRGSRREGAAAQLEPRPRIDGRPHAELLQDAVADASRVEPDGLADALEREGIIPIWARQPLEILAQATGGAASRLGRVPEEAPQRVGDDGDHETPLADGRPTVVIQREHGVVQGYPDAAV